MDKISAVKVLIAAVDAGSLSGAAGRLGRSPAAITRMIAFLEEELGVVLLHRTTRSIRLSEAGERYVAAYRRILADLEEADLMAAGTQATPRGRLTITAPVMFGARLFRPIIDEFLLAYPDVHIQYLLLDRLVRLTDEGIDVALRIASLPDSSLIAIKVGEVRRVVAASPHYLENRPVIRVPEDLAAHECITHGEPSQNEIWSFPPLAGTDRLRNIRISSRLHVNLIESAIDTAADGHGIVRVLSYQIEQEVRDGRLKIILADAEPSPIPIHLLTPEGRLESAKVRAFVDFAVARLRK